MFFIQEPRTRKQTLTQEYHSFLFDVNRHLSIKICVELTNTEYTFDIEMSRIYLIYHRLKLHVLYFSFLNKNISVL